MPLTKAQKATKWQTGVQNSVDLAIDNVNALVVSPASLAIAKGADMRTNWLAAYDSGKWEANLSRYLDISKWQERMVAGLERNRTITDGQLAKITDHFGRQGYATGLITSIVALIDATGNGVENTPSFSTTMQKIFLNIAIEHHIEDINEGDTAQEILDIIAAYLIAQFGYTATP